MDDDVVGVYTEHCGHCHYDMSYQLLRYGVATCGCPWHAGKKTALPYLCCPQCGYVMSANSAVRLCFGTEDRVN